jgi:hypothetical protein
MNIITNTPPPSEADLPEGVRQGLLVVAQRYLLDLGISCNNTSTASIVTPLGETKGNPWTINIAGPGQNTPLAYFLQQVTSNPQDCGILNASAKTAFSQYYGMKVTNQLPPELKGADPAFDMAQLMAQITTQADAVGIQGAELTDAQNAEYNALLSFAESQVSKIPVIGAPLGDAQTAANLLGFNLPSFSTNNASLTYENDQQNFIAQQMEINVPMVQGMLDYHAIPASDVEGMPWYQDGKIVLATQQDAAEFDSWFQTHYQSQLETQITNYQYAMGNQNQSSGLNPAYDGS